MNPKLKTAWCGALRSGAYAQTYGMLTQREQNHTFSYCALGVLWKLRGKPDHGTFTLGSDISIEQQEVVIQMNDKEKRSFVEIADYVEANF